MNTKGTLPQWICASALTVLVIVEITQWQGFNANWVSAVSTAVLALAALAGLAGVLIPLQLEHARRRALHLENIVAIVLDPIRYELETDHIAVVSRIASPLACRNPYGLGVASPPSSRQISYGLMNPAEGVGPLADKSLHDAVYADVKRNHYPQLLTDWERFKEEYTVLIQTTLSVAQDMEKLLRQACDFSDLAQNQNQRRGCWYASLALYAFERIWLSDFEQTLTARTDTPNDPNGQWVLFCEYNSNSYAQGSQQDVKNLRSTVEGLISGRDLAPIKKDADILLQKLQSLRTRIADIRANGMLHGDCTATS